MDALLNSQGWTYYQTQPGMDTLSNTARDGNTIKQSGMDPLLNTARDGQTIKQPGMDPLSISQGWVHYYTARDGHTVKSLGYSYTIQCLTTTKLPKITC